MKDLISILNSKPIIEPNLAEVTKKAKHLEHIIQKCDPLATTSPIIQSAGAVPSLCSHIAQSQDQDSDNIPKPFKSTKGKGGKKAGKGKSKPQQQPQPPSSPPEEEEQYEETNNYYHNENYRGNSRGADDTGVNKVAENQIEDPNKGEGDNKIITGAYTKATVDNLTHPVEVITIIITMVIIKAEVVVAVVVTI